MTEVFLTRSWRNGLKGAYLSNGSIRPFDFQSSPPVVQGTPLTPTGTVSRLHLATFKTGFHLAYALETEELTQNLLSASAGTGLVEDMQAPRSLRAAINAQLGRLPWTGLTTQDIANLHQLSIHDSRIQDLSLLEHATNLQSLHGSSSRVTHLDILPELPNLGYLDLSSCGLDLRPGSPAARQIRQMQERGASVHVPHQRMPWNWLPDRNLEFALRQQRFGHSANWDEEWDWEEHDPDHPGEIYFPNAGISSLEGLQYARNLQQVDLTANHIVDLSPLRHLPDLHSLKLGNPGQHIPRFGGNSARDLSPLQRCGTLQELDLTGNQVTDISPLLDSFAENAVLLLDSNGLDERPGSTSWQHVETLRHKGIGASWQNQRSPWNWALEPGLAAAIRQSLGLAPGASFQVQHHHSLHSLDAPQSGIRRLETIDYAIHLTHVDLRENQIRDVSQLARLPALEWADLSGNFITDLTPMFDSSADSFSLELDNNGLDLREDSATRRHIQKLTAMGHSLEEGGIQKNPWNWMLEPALENVLREALNKHPGQEFEWQDAEVSHLALAGFGITSLNGLELARRLTYLNLSENRIGDISALADMSMLNVLLLSAIPHHHYRNRISDLTPLSGMRRLEELDLQGNRITNLEPILHSIRAYGNLNVRQNALDLAYPGSRNDLQVRILQARNVNVDADGWNASPSALASLLEPELETILRSQLGMGEFEEFQEYHLSSLTHLDLSESRVKTLQGLEFFPSLEQLILPEKRPANIPPLSRSGESLVIQTGGNRSGELQMATDSGQVAGRNSVLDDPLSYELYRREHIMDGRFGAKMLEGENGVFRVTWSVEGSEDLSGWSEIGTFEQEVEMDGNYFLRLAPRNTPME